MTSPMIVLFIFLQSLFVVILGQTCRNLPVYTPCSTNPDCGCLPFSSADDQSSVCAYLHLNASKLRTCSEMNYYCDQPYTVCVHHPDLSKDKPLCYPTGMAAQDLCPPLFINPTSSPSPSIEEICANVSWAKRGVTVAGSNYSGSGLHELRSPSVILFDLKTDTLYIADNGNARIVSWQSGAKRGAIVAGDNGEGNRTDQLAWISGMVLNPKDGSLILCDARNRRIVRWTRRAQQGEVLIDKLYCSGLALDSKGLLYIIEHDNHRITRWILGDTLISDRVVAGGNGKGNRLNQLSEPSAVFIDHNRTVYVADFSNDRIVKWNEDATEGILLGKIRYPRSVHVALSGNVYAIDGYYSRVMRWTPNSVNGTTIIGEQQYTLSQAYDLAFDQHGNVYVANYGNGRIDKFDIEKSACL